MPDIRESNDIVTQITTVKVPPDHQEEVLELMEQRAKFMATQPGFVSVSLHKSEDGSHVVNYVQWTNRKKLEAATTRPSSASNGRASASWSRRRSPASIRLCTSRRHRAAASSARRCRLVEAPPFR